MDKHYAFDSGMPTGPDVTMLMKQWPALKAEDRVLYEDVERLLGVAKEQSRFWSVTDAWRRRLKEGGLIVECEPARGFYVATAEQILAKSYTTMSRAVRLARKQRIALATIRPQDDQQKAVRDHQMRLMWVTEKQASQNRKNILPLAAPAEQVRIAPPKTAEAG